MSDVRFEEYTGPTLACRSCDQEWEWEQRSVDAEFWQCPNCNWFNRYPSTPPTQDPVNKPAHYLFGPYEVIDIIEAWLRANDVPPGEGFLWASMQQYLFRYRRKKGKQDLEKALFYLKRILDGYTD